MAPSKKKNQKKKAAAVAAAKDADSSRSRGELHRQEEVLISRLEALVKECPLRSTVRELLADVLRLRQVVEELAGLQARLAAEAGVNAAPIDQTPRTASQNEAALARFEEWFLKHAPDGLCEGAVRFAANTEFGNALKAKRKLAAGETFIRVPRKLCLSTDLLRLSGDILAGRVNKRPEQRESAAVGQRSKTGPWEDLAGLPKSLLHPLEADPLIRNIPSVALAVLLVLEAWRGPRSFWSAYIQTLPRRSELALPFLADPRMLARELAGDPATLYEVLKKQRSTIIQYAHLRPLTYRVVAANRTMFGSAKQEAFENVGKAVGLPDRVARPPPIPLFALLLYPATDLQPFCFVKGLQTVCLELWIQLFVSDPSAFFPSSPFPPPIFLSGSCVHHTRTCPASPGLTGSGPWAPSWPDRTASPASTPANRSPARVPMPAVARRPPAWL